MQRLPMERNSTSCISADETKANSSTGQHQLYRFYPEVTLFKGLAISSSLSPLTPEKTTESLTVTNNIHAWMREANVCSVLPLPSKAMSVILQKLTLLLLFVWWVDLKFYWEIFCFNSTDSLNSTNNIRIKQYTLV